jgi:two-component system nitrate/nitrite sensor histidine kinase NarX
METQVCKQTERIEQKKRSLQVLYDVAASLNVSRDLSDLLVRFLHTMRDMVDAKAGTVRMLNEHQQMEMVASIGLDEEVVEKERMVPVARCMCGNALSEGEVMFQSELHHCSHFVGRPLLDADDELEMIAVPLQYRGETLGVYNLFVEKSSIEPREDLKALFTSIGRHLGMAIEKARLDSEAKRLFIMQERTALANELHDSLAQTLASLRFQVSMLQETLDHASTASIHEEIEQIKSGLDDAYTELRELLAHFRAPINTRGLLPALEDLVNSFRRQTGMYVLLQTEWDSARLPVDLEIQVLRIVQEALANVRKHSHAQTVRVMLKSDPDGNYRVLIEDDGVGLCKPAFSGHPGEHIGQSIMQERARRLGGELCIESETGEGTRLLLTFRYPAENRAHVSKVKEMRTIPLVRE